MRGLGYTRTNWIKQGDESLQQIVSIFGEESLPQIVSGIYYPNAILKYLSEQDICFNSKDLIDSERNAVDLYDQRDSKGQISFTSLTIWNILDKIFVLIKSNRTRYPQFCNYSGIQSSSEMCLPPTKYLAVEEATYNSLICYEDFLWTKKQPAIFGCVVGKSSLQPYAQQGLGSIWPDWPWPLLPALEGAPKDVIHHSEIGTKQAMKEVTNHFQVLLNLIGRSKHFCPQYNDCVMDLKAERALYD